MVIKGQFLERATLIPSGGFVLEGLSHRGEKLPPVLILPPPPVEGSGMDSVVGAEVSFACAREGHQTLRFNYQGVGGSQGRISKTPETWLDDALAAYVVCSENAAGAVPLLVSIGASDAVALELVKRRPIVGLAIINPLMSRAGDLASVPPMPLTVVLAEEDARQNRGEWSDAVMARAGEFVVVAGASRSFQRNLPMVGKAVSALAASVGT